MTMTIKRQIKETGKLKPFQFFFLDDTGILYHHNKVDLGSLILAIKGKKELESLLGIKDILSNMEIGYNYGEVVISDDKRKDLLIIDLNKKFARIAGFERQDIRGKTYTQVFGKNGYTDSLIKRISEAASYRTNTSYIQFARSGNDSFEANTYSRGKDCFISIFKDIPIKRNKMLSSFNKYDSFIKNIFEKICLSQALMFIIDLPYTGRKELSLLSSIGIANGLNIIKKSLFDPQDLVITSPDRHGMYYYDEDERQKGGVKMIEDRELEVYYLFSF